MGREGALSRVARLSHTRVVQIAERFGRQGVAYPGNMVREDECAGGQMIGKIGRQSVKIRGLLLRPSRARNPAAAERIAVTS